MSKDGEAENAEIIEAMCEMRGLGRAFALFPDIVSGAFVRGRRPIGSLPKGFSATTEPASRFAAEPESAE